MHKRRRWRAAAGAAARQGARPAHQSALVARVASKLTANKVRIMTVFMLEMTRVLAVVPGFADQQWQTLFLDSHDREADVGCPFFFK